MIVIDGRQSAMQIGNFANLEEMLVKVMEDEVMDDHIVTDVLVNDEAFSEIYPHQAEDIHSGGISRVEVRTASMKEIAGDITTEMHKVIGLMQSGGTRVASSFRQGDVAEGLEVLQDLLEVTRHFLNTISILEERFPMKDADLIPSIGLELDALLTEMSDVMVSQDWVLLSDLIEFEFLPVCHSWKKVLENLALDIASTKLE